MEPELYAIALRLSGSPPDARDLVQDTFERGLKAFPSLRQGSNVAGWLATILQHLFLDRVRRPVHERAVEPEKLASVPAPETAAADSLWTRVTDEALNAAIARLAPEFQEVFLLHSRGHKYDAIAARLGIPRATVGTRLARARRKLRELLVASGGER